MINVAMEPMLGIKRKPAARVPTMAPNAPIAYIMPSAYSDLSLPFIAAMVRMGAGIPANRDGRRNALNVIKPIAIIGFEIFSMIGLAKSRSK